MSDTIFASDTPITTAAVIMTIDGDVDALYGDVLGNRAQEYTRAQTEAQAFKDAGYAGAAPPSVSSWSDAKGWTAQEAADDILSTAQQWLYAQAQIRSVRLAHKERAREAADDPDQCASIYFSWKDFLAAARAQLGLTG